MLTGNGQEIKIGILCSLTGTMGITERGQYQAALLAIRQINDEGGIKGKRLLPIVEDIASDPYLAAKKAEKLILSDKVVALIGTYTSVCRKTIIPVLEKYDSLLLYPTQYEGGEQHKNVFYCGPLPNQQLLHFIPWIIQHVGKTFYVIGSDYIYPRETTRHVRYLVEANNGLIIGEHYSELGNQKFSKILREIQMLNPDVVFSTLVGDSVIAFYQQYYQFGIRQPIASPITAESEVAAISSHFAAGHYTAFPYFSSVQTAENTSFLTEYRRTYGTDIISSAMENAYNCVFLLAEALRKSKEFDTASIRRSLPGLTFQAPQGKIMVDKTNQHLWLNSRIGRVNAKGQFDILWEAEEPIPPVPFYAYPNTSKAEAGPNDPDGQLQEKMVQYESLIEELKRATQFLPYTFAFFDNQGVLVSVFSHEEAAKWKISSILKPGTNCWTCPALKQSGIGLALSGHLTSIVSRAEHGTDELSEWISIGIPIQRDVGSLQGVFGVFLYSTDSLDQKHLDILVGMLTYIAKSCTTVIDQAKNYGMFYQLLNDLSRLIPESLYVIQNGKIIFLNQPAQALLTEKHDSIYKLLQYVSDNLPSEPKTVIKKESSGELLEIRITPAEKYAFVSIKQFTVIGKDPDTNPGTDTIFSKNLIGSNERFLRAITLVKSAAKTDANVLILGESGTGKELFARAIHNESERRDKPFVALNCAAIPRELINADLFGYEDGAFTGAKKGGSPGKFEAANGGTLFLDEIGDMPLELQATLLRVLQEKEVTRVGSHKSIPVDVRVIAATNKNLHQEMAIHGSFRNDLYFRLNVFTIELPPLRERKDDILELACHFIKALSQKTGTSIKTLSKEAALLLEQYSWPGNVRELENVMERAFYISENESTITKEHLPKYILDSSEPEMPPGDYRSLLNVKHLRKTSNNKEKDMIVESLVRFKGNISKTAKYLGISRTTLYRKLEEFRLK
ncbi:transporter substrate-binding protein [Brevibacillus massiliensis]|uniref:transporter substrate-binding protein n=1 Tax=Brevibacillus massiliensis TaxID=1118054 RepID=UPI00030654F3|nr:transporter substrate-binding protein [Brevibacillus massiliensis]